MITFGSLFSGIGGMDLGLERAGMVCKWQVEIDEYCQKVLNKHWPNIKRYKDVKEVGKHNLEPVDLVAGGFPCQPHSVAGKRGGKDDDRNLWPEYLRIIREIKPAWVVGENVPGIITTMLDDILLDLENAGYTQTVFNIPACALGANHIRYRIFIIAHSNVFGWEKGGNKGIQPKIKKSWTQKPERLCKIVPKSRDVANAIGQRGCGRNAKGQDAEDAGQFTRSTQFRNWDVEPDVDRVVDGIPNRVDRLKALGNAVVPQVAEYIGRCIVEANKRHEQI